MLKLYDNLKINLKCNFEQFEKYLSVVLKGDLTWFATV